MNSRCICAKCAALKSVIGIGCNFRAIPVTVKPTKATKATAKAGRRAGRMKPSRETCLHRESIIPLGVGYAIRPRKTVCLVSLRKGHFLLDRDVPFRDSFVIFSEEGLYHAQETFCPASGCADGVRRGARAGRRHCRHRYARPRDYAGCARDAHCRAHAVRL